MTMGECKGSGILKLGTLDWQLSPGTLVPAAPIVACLRELLTISSLFPVELQHDS